MKSHPILFSGDMVRAILEGRKTQTRRPVKQAMRFAELGVPAWQPNWCPLGVPGDELWVRETWGGADEWFCQSATEPPEWVAYRADGSVRWFGRSLHGGEPDDSTDLCFDSMRWRPSIHMPRWASRITLKVTDVRVQRLMDASEADIIAEGFTNSAGYQSALMKAYGDGITYVNPWVWAITFEVKQ